MSHFRRVHQSIVEHLLRHVHHSAQSSYPRLLRGPNEAFPAGLADELHVVGDALYHEDPVFRARAHQLGNLLAEVYGTNDHGLDRGNATSVGREAAIRALVLMPIVDALIPDNPPPTTERAYRP
jgi:hypothetical protein